MGPHHKIRLKLRGRFGDFRCVLGVLMCLTHREMAERETELVSQRLLQSVDDFHRASVRSRIMNQVDPKALSCFGDVMPAIVRGIEESQNDF